MSITKKLFSKHPISNISKVLVINLLCKSIQIPIVQFAKIYEYCCTNFKTGGIKICDIQKNSFPNKHPIDDIF